MVSNEKFDIIVKFDEANTPEEFDEYQAIEEIETELKNHNPCFYIKETEFYNVFLVELMEKNLKTATELAKIASNNEFKLLPVEDVMYTQPKTILENLINISNKKIKHGETFTISCNVEGRQYIKSEKEFKNQLYSAANQINGEVDENSPDWAIHVEVVGGNTGISVLREI